MAFTGKRSLVAGVLAAVGASVCCVLPLVLLMLGISGTWISSLSVMEPFRPFFVALTLLFLGLAARKLYSTPNSCEAGTPCADSAIQRRQRVIFWVVALLLLGLLAVPMVAPFFY